MVGSDVLKLHEENRDVEQTLVIAETDQPTNMQTEINEGLKKLGGRIEVTRVLQTSHTNRLFTTIFYKMKS